MGSRVRAMRVHWSQGSGGMESPLGAGRETVMVERSTGSGLRDPKGSGLKEERNPRYSLLGPSQHKVPIGSGKSFLNQKQ